MGKKKKAAAREAIDDARGYNTPPVQVSAEAIVGIGEEFDELQPLLQALVGQRTPVEISLLHSGKELIPFAKEVGLLADYKPTEEGGPRYKVPDLYRGGLQMTRKGPG